MATVEKNRSVSPDCPVEKKPTPAGIYCAWRFGRDDVGDDTVGRDTDDDGLVDLDGGQKDVQMGFFFTDSGGMDLGDERRHNGAGLLCLLFDGQIDDGGFGRRGRLCFVHDKNERSFSRQSVRLGNRESLNDFLQGIDARMGFGDGYRMFAVVDFTGLAFV